MGGHCEGKLVRSPWLRDGRFNAVGCPNYGVLARKGVMDVVDMPCPYDLVVRSRVEILVVLGRVRVWRGMFLRVLAPRFPFFHFVVRLH